MHYIIWLALLVPSAVFADIVDPFSFNPWYGQTGQAAIILNAVFTLAPLVLVIAFIIFIVLVFRHTDPEVKTTKVTLPGFPQLFKETWALFWKRFRSIAGITGFGILSLLAGSVIIVGAPIAGIYFFSLPSAILFLLCTVLIFLIGSAVISLWLGALIALSSSEEQMHGAKRWYHEAIKKFIHLWTLLLLSGFVLSGSSVAFLIPALILSIFFYFSAFAVLIEGKNGFEALYASYQLVRNAWWKVFGRLIVLTICIAGIMLGIGIVFGLIAGFYGTIASAVLSRDVAGLEFVSSVLSGIVFAFFGLFIFSFVTFFVSRLYSALKTAKQNITFGRSSIVFRVMCVFFITVTIGYFSVFYLQIPRIPFGEYNGKEWLEGVTKDFLSGQSQGNTVEKQEIPGGQDTVDSVEDTKDSKVNSLERNRIREADLQGYTGAAEDDFFTIYKSTDRDFSIELLAPRKWNSQSTEEAHVFKRLDDGVQFIVARALQDKDTTDELAYSALEALKASYPDDREELSTVEVRESLVGFIQPASLFSVTLTPSGVRMRQDIYSVIVDGVPIFISAIAHEEDFQSYAPIFDEMINTLSIQKLMIPQEVGLDSSYRPSVLNLYYRIEKKDEHPYYFADFWKEGKKKKEYIFGKRIVIDARTGKKVTDGKILKEFYARDGDLLDGIDPKTRLNVDEKNRPVAPSFGDGKIPVFSPDEILVEAETIKESYGPTAAVSNPQLYYSEFNISYWYLDLYTTKKSTDQPRWKERLVFDTFTGTLMTQDKEYMKDTLSALGALKGQVPQGIDPKTRLLIEE